MAKDTTNDGAKDLTVSDDISRRVKELEDRIAALISAPFTSHRMSERLWFFTVFWGKNFLFKWSRLFVSLWILETCTTKPVIRKTG